MLVPNILISSITCFTGFSAQIDVIYIHSSLPYASGFGLLLVKTPRNVPIIYVHMQVCITFSDFGKMQDVCNFLVEKLDSSVIISPPDFYHTSEAIDILR